MRSLTRAAALCLFTAVACQGAPADLWPAQLPKLADPAVVDARIAALKAATPALPPVLAPAERFQETFLRILHGAPSQDWLGTIRDLSTASASDPVTSAVRDVARAWLARAERQEIGTVLDDYYAQNVRYPASLSEVDRNLPKELQLDPWGEPWAYRLHAPQGFAKETAQRYQLGPARLPNLGTLREATVERQSFTPPAWQIILRPVGDSHALEFHLGGAMLGLIQPGGKIDRYTLAYAGDHWALMADTDQLFTATF
jgi:hypothetical protein